MMNQPLKKIVVFGVGLIGGSFSMGLRRAGLVEHIVGVGRNPENLRNAIELGVIDEIAVDIDSAVADADLIMIATPVGQMGEIMRAIAGKLKPDVLITDAGSTKQDVVALARQHLSQNITQFIPGHPIAGGEHSGVKAAKVDLFENKNVVLTPLVETDAVAIQNVSKLWNACGARVASMKPSTHDKIFAAVSHLPHLLAFALVDDIARKPYADDLFKYAASGFRDFTRIASSQPEMWRDISIANRDALLQQLGDYQVQLERIKIMLLDADASALEAIFTNAQTARNHWLGE